jgi:hypothetical protein
MSTKDKLVERFKHKPHTSGSPIKETALKEIYNKLLLDNLIKEENE